MTVTSHDRRTRSRRPTWSPSPSTSVEVSVPKGTLVIRAAEQVGVQIPRFCDHPLLAPGRRLPAVPGRGRAARRRQPKTMMARPDGSSRRRPARWRVADGMVVNTQVTSQVADKAQQGVMEFLLINHPLDCPVCDKGGECPLQNQAMSNGRGETRFTETKRTFPKPINISAQVLLDRERCVLCARCTRFSEQIAGDPFIALIERGALQQVGIYEQRALRVLLLGQHDPDLPGRRADLGGVPLPLAAVRPGLHAVGRASTTPAAAAHPRRPPARQGHPPARRQRPRGQRGVDHCDKDRFAFLYARQADRLTTRWCATRRPASCRPASWPEAFARRRPRPAGARAARSAC